jgi:thiamine biosynthesis lipoprotein
MFACVRCWILLAALVSFGCDRAATEVFELGGPAFGTTYTVKLAEAPADGAGAELGRQIADELSRINGLLSTYDPNSELSRFNAARTTDWVPVSDDTFAVAREAARISAWSGGAFDCTIGRLVRLWNFGPRVAGAAGPKIPDEAEIERALAVIGPDEVELRSVPPALRKKSASLEIDFSAIAKGYAVDRVAQLLEAQGIRDYLVEIGGEVRLRGRKASGALWRLAIESPDESVRTSQGVIEAENLALASSGDYRNFYRIGDKRFSHTIDPRTGRPVTHGLAAVTVTAASCMEADAVATALMVLGPDAGYDMALRQGYAALFLTRQGETIVERATPALRGYISRSAPP